MSGAGRGTPRISPAFSSDPLAANILPPTEGGGTVVGENSVVSHGNGRWTFHLELSKDPMVLTGTFAPFNAAGSTYNIPMGGLRGLVVVEYEPAAANSQLDVKINIPSLLDILSISDSGNATFPNLGFPLAGDLPIYSPTYRTPVQNPATVTEFGIPFCVPAGGFDTVSFSFREIGTVGGSVNITDLYIDNFGC